VNWHLLLNASLASIGSQKPIRFVPKQTAGFRVIDTPLDPRNTPIYGCKSLFFWVSALTLAWAVRTLEVISLVRVAPSNFGLSRSLKRRFRILAVLESNRFRRIGCAALVPFKTSFLGIFSEFFDTLLIR
jgi:hypothetical protein